MKLSALMDKTVAIPIVGKVVFNISLMTLADLHVMRVVWVRWDKVRNAEEVTLFVRIILK